MAVWNVVYTFVAGQVPTAANWNANPSSLSTLLSGQVDKANVDSSSSDGIMTMDEAQTITGAKTWTAAAQFSNTVTVGVDDTGYDVQFFGATSGKFLLWDESADSLELTDSTPLVFGTGADSSIQYDGTNLLIAPRDVGSGNLIVNDACLFLINDTANANQTVGLTINQGANDDEIFTLKSSDVSHGMTSITEDDTFFDIRKPEGAAGGARLRGHKDADGAAGFALQLAGALGEAADTTHTTAGRGIVETLSSIKSGTSTAAPGANGNLVAFLDNSGTRFIVDKEGDYFYDGADGGAFDGWDDLSLVATANSMLKGAVDTGREWVTTNKDALVEAGLIGYCSPESEARGHRGLWNGAAFQRLFIGTFAQVGDILHGLKAELEDTKARLNLLEA